MLNENDLGAKTRCLEHSIQNFFRKEKSFLKYIKYIDYLNLVIAVCNTILAIVFPIITLKIYLSF